jgi:hypothetical protein
MGTGEAAGAAEEVEAVDVGVPGIVVAAIHRTSGPSGGNCSASASVRVHINN